MSRYGELADLYTYGAPSSAFGTLTDAEREAGIEAASAEADSALRARGPLPLTRWGNDLKLKVIVIAAYELMCRAGFNPNAGSDVNYRLRAEDARAWLKAVARGEMHPDVDFSPAKTETSTAYAQPRVRSNTNRGW